MDIVSATIAWFTNPAQWSGPDGIPARLFEHVAISGISMLVAILIALPVGLWIGHTRRGVGLAVNLSNLGRAVPSLAVIAIVLPITAAIDPELGFKVFPTLIAMVLLAIPPILVDTYAGVAEVDAELVEAARGMGHRERQILGRVEVPLALPVIMVGIESATVQVIATATLGALFGFGGLGDYLVGGVANQDVGEIWCGVVLVAGLVLVAEGLLALIQRRLTSPGLARTGGPPGQPAAADLRPSPAAS
ncbi:MAG: ABC transporter permease [Candidatus Limnocylindrales bacterium]